MPFAFGHQNYIRIAISVPRTIKQRYNFQPMLSNARGATCNQTILMEQRATIPRLMPLALKCVGKISLRYTNCLPSRVN
jgi:hypothetical protein